MSDKLMKTRPRKKSFILSVVERTLTASASGSFKSDRLCVDETRFQVVLIAEATMVLKF